MGSLRKNWVLLVISGIIFSGLLAVYKLYKNYFWENEAMEFYRLIKAGMEENYHSNSKAFLELWQFSKQLPTLDYVNFSHEDQITIQINQRESLLPIQYRYYDRIEMDSVLQNISFSSENRGIICDGVTMVFNVGSLGHDSLCRKEGVKNQIMAYTPAFDTAFVLKNNYDLEFSGFVNGKDFEEVLLLIDITTSQLKELKKLLKKTGITEGFRKDRDGNVYLGYWAFPGSGAFEYVIPTAQYELGEDIYEAGMIDQGLGVFWQYGTRPVSGPIICLDRPLIIRN